ncbi:AraC family transcriptional regulator [Paenibacillus mendelii]|uniref:Helix-turn-helix domain-containing protein n=1 Tax=Paenibacillus mendelii TaxID=206163 RepID=A0ABV6J246_9BACL|nr:AraC family transcriptional regulator [Paenibacillus mendelii]MCQ6562883.1 AraC family transcriptional regulator [Paenibacillus mendelii]
MKLTFQSNMYLKDPKALPVYVERKVHREEDLPPIHEHEFYELVLILHGQVFHYFENGSYRLHGGDMILIRPGQFHRYVLDDGDSFELINCLFLPELFEPDWLTAIDPDGKIESFLLYPFSNRKDEFHPRISLALAESRQVERLLEEMLVEQTQGRAFSGTVIRLKLFELFHLILRYQNEAIHREKHTGSRRTDPKVIMIQRVHQYLAENPELKLDIEQMANTFGVSSRHLNRLFKQQTGKTVMEMLHFIRIERAKLLLMHTNDRVVDIAARVGYDDTSFFTKLFIRKVKCSPGKYREEMQFSKVH